MENWLPLINWVLLFAIVVMALFSTHNLWKMARILNKRIAHLYSVINMLDMPSTVRKLFNMDPMKIPNTPKERINLVNKLSHESYVELRGRVVKAIDKATCPEEKEKFTFMLQELDNISMLLNTLDEKSSPEYVNQVMMEIPASLRKLSERFRNE